MKIKKMLQLKKTTQKLWKYLFLFWIFCSFWWLSAAQDIGTATVNQPLEDSNTVSSSEHSRQTQNKFLPIIIRMAARHGSLHTFALLMEAAVPKLQERISTQTVSQRMMWQEIIDAIQLYVKHVSTIPLLAERKETNTTTREDTIRKSNFLNQISVQFCDWTQELNNVVEQLASSEVCLTLNNDSDEDLNFWIKFAEQELSNMGTRACRADYQNPIASFIQTAWDNSKDIVVPAKSVIEKKFSIRFPLWVSWEQKWCVAYGVSEDTKKHNGWMVSLVIRKVIYFDFMLNK
jgi:hypothetical protein